MNELLKLSMTPSLQFHSSSIASSGTGLNMLGLLSALKLRTGLCLMVNVGRCMGIELQFILESSDNKTDEGIRDEKLTELSAKPSVYWIQAKDIGHDLNAEAEEYYVAMEALSDVLCSVQPLIVYFPDSSMWLSRAVSKANREAFVHKVQEMFDQVSGPVVLICGQNKVETESKEKKKIYNDTSEFGSSC